MRLYAWSRRLALLAYAAALLSACGGDEAAQPLSERLRIDPEAVDFGEVFIGSFSKRRVLLSNEGARSLHLRITDLPRDFEVEPLHPVVQPGKAAELWITFRPLAEGPSSALLPIRGASEEWTLPLLGVGIDDALGVPEGVDFGDLPVGGTRRQEIVLTSLADAPLTLSFTTAGTPDFRVGLREAELPGRDTIAVPLEFTPHDAGPTQGWLHVRPCPSCLPVEIPLYGVGRAPELYPLPARVDFGQVGVGRVEWATLTVENRGNETAALGEVRLESSPEDSPFHIEGGELPAKLAPREILTLALRFLPEGKGPATDRLVFSDPSGATLLVVPVEGEGGGARLAAGALDFGATAVGHPHHRSLRLTREGAAEPVIVTSVAVEGGGASAFSVTTPPLPLSVEEQVDLQVAAIPVAEGLWAAELRVQTANPSQPELRVPLRARGVRSDCDLQVLESELLWGLVDAEEKHRRRLELQQGMGGDCVLLGATLEPDLGDYSLIGLPEGGVHLRAGERALFYVELGAAPGREGFAQARLAFETADGPPLTFDLRAYRADPAPAYVVGASVELPPTPLGHFSWGSVRVERTNASLPALVRLGKDSSPAFQVSSSRPDLPIDIEVTYTPTELGEDEGQIEVSIAPYPEPLRIPLKAEARPPCEEDCLWPNLECSGTERMTLGEEAVFTCGLDELPADHSSRAWRIRSGPDELVYPLRLPQRHLCDAIFPAPMAGSYVAEFELRTGSFGGRCEIVLEVVDADEPPAP